MNGLVMGGLRSLMQRGQPLASSSSPAFALNQTMDFSKYISKARAKRLPLTTKRAGKGYYKGTGSRKEGVLTSKGRFLLHKDKCTELVVPDLTNFKLKAYVGPGAKRHVIDTKVNLSSA